MNFSPLIGLIFTLITGYFITALLVRDPISTHRGSQKKPGRTANLDQMSEAPLLDTPETNNQNAEINDVDQQNEPNQPSVSLRWVRLSLIFGVGYGVTSLTYFFWRALFDGLGWPYFAFEFSLILVLLAMYLRAGLRPRLRVPVERRITQRSLWLVLIPAAFVLGLVALVSTYFLGTSLLKNGVEDAWMIWNLAARYLTRETPPWINLFSNALADPTEPLMLGSSVSRMWVFQGREAVWAPQFIGLVFGLSSVALTSSLVALLRGKLAGFLAGLGVMAASGFLILVPAQSVDLPLAFFFLAVGASLYIFDIKLFNDRRILIFAGLCTGIGLWTSNNAWLLMLAVIIVRVIWVWRNGEAQENFSDWQSYALGLLPVLSLVLLFRLIFVPNLPNYTDIAEFLDQLFDWNQFVGVLSNLTEQVFTLTANKSAPYLLLVVFVLLAGIQREAFRKKANRLLLGLIAALAMLTTVSVLINPVDPVLGVAWNIERLLIRLWPLAIFLTIMIIRLPGIAQERRLSQTEAADSYPHSHL